MNFKKATALGMAAVMTMSLTACGSSEATNTEVAKTETTKRKGRADRTRCRTNGMRTAVYLVRRWSAVRRPTAARPPIARKRRRAL